MSKTEKEMLQSMSHGDGKAWIKELIELHKRQVRELERYVEQFEVASDNEMKPERNNRIPSTVDVLSWAAMQISYVANNARIDRLPGITSAIVLANTKK